MRNWERCARSPRDETLAQYFELLLERAKRSAIEDNVQDKDAMETSEEWSDKEQERREEKEEMRGKEGDKRANKENVDQAEGQNRSSQANHPTKPLARARQPSGTPLRHTIQKTDSNQGKAERSADTNGIGNNRTAIILTEEQQMEKEAELVSAMLNMAGEGAASSGGNASQD